MTDKYILVDGEAIPATLHGWAQYFETADRKIAETVINKRTNLRVSTVFLGLDHNFSGKGPPLLFESMVFQGNGFGCDLECRRYPSLEMAKVGHAELVKEFTCSKWPSFFWSAMHFLFG